MTNGSNLISSVLTLIRRELENLGMQKRPQDVYTRELTSGVIGWVGLNRAFRKKEQVLAISPVIGVRHQLLEQLLATVLNEEFHRYAPPTISINLGYLTSEKHFMSLLFKDEDKKLQVRNLVASTVEFGLPFMESNITLSALIRSMETGAGVPHQLTYRLPIAYMLAQDPSKATSYVSRHLATLGDAEDPNSRRYREFAARFLDHMRSQNPGSKMCEL